MRLCACCFSRGMSTGLPRSMRQPWKNSNSAYVFDLVVCDLGLVVPRPGPQFPPFQNAEYSYVVI